MNEIGRDILMSHLYDLRALELVKGRCVKTLNDNTQRLKTLGHPYLYQKPRKAYVFIWPIIASVVGVYVSFGFFAAIQQKEALLICLVVYGIIAPLIMFIILNNVLASKLELYKENIKNENERIERESIEIQRLNVQNKELFDKLNEVKAVLADTYSSLNIIPNQFRNVQGICYLYDYLSSSQETLESAFLNYNVNNININIKHMMSQQSEMILQQYITNAKLESNHKTMEAMVNKLSSIEANTAASTQFAAQAAAHAKAIDFFESYRFFKEN